MMSLPAIFGFILLNLFTLCTLIAKPHPQRSPKQGICGTVTERRGNQMPGPGQAKPNPGKPVVREVAIFAVLTMDQVVTDDAGFITDTRGIRPVKTAKTDKQGKFCVYGLPVSTYSVMIREPQGLYYNISDMDNRMNPVTVKKGKITTATVEILHGASF